jgi:hypothetical protein
MDQKKRLIGLDPRLSVARMNPFTPSRLSGLLFSVCLAGTVCHAQDLTPRAYVITPIHSNAVILTYSYFTGSILFDSSIPVTNASGNPSVQIFSLYHALNFFGRSANITATLPYGFGRFQGQVGSSSTETKIYRSGLLDAVFRFSVNLKGGPAMSANEFRRWRQKTIIGASLKIVAPTGQYDPTRLINQGSNRWAFKPELGVSRRWGHWLVDGYGGVWFFTTNLEFYSHNQVFPGTRTQSEKPIGSFEGHLSYEVKNNPRFWFSLDGNYWRGGTTSLNGVENPLTIQGNSRIGATASVPFTNHQSVKVSYSDGAYIRFGGNYQNVSVAWQYSWLGRLK